MMRRLLACGLLMAVLLVSVHEAVAEENEVGPLGTKYSEWKSKVVYTSHSQYLVRGMQPFYNVTNMILKWFEPEPMIPDGE